MIKTDYTPEEKCEIESVKVQYEMYNDQVKLLEIQLRVAQKKRDNTFQKYWGLTHTDA